MTVGAVIRIINGFGQIGFGLFLYFREVRFGSHADRAEPVFRQIVESRTRSDIISRIANPWVIGVEASLALVTAKILMLLDRLSRFNALDDLIG